MEKMVKLNNANDDNNDGDDEDDDGNSSNNNNVGFDNEDGTTRAQIHVAHFESSHRRSDDDGVTVANYGRMSSIYRSRIILKCWQTQKKLRSNNKGAIWEKSERAGEHSFAYEQR